METKRVFTKGCILARTKSYSDVNVIIHEMFSFVRMFSRIRNGWHLYHPVDMLQSKQVRLLLRNKIKRWTCVIYLCHMPMRTVCFLQHSNRLIFCFTDEEGSYLTNSGTLGSRHNRRSRIFAFKCFRKIAKKKKKAITFVLIVLQSVYPSAWVSSALNGIRYIFFFFRKTA
jgi:hypothetical protein